MRLLTCLMIALLVTACGSGDAAPTGGAAASSNTRTEVAAQATVYTYVLSGAGVTFSADVHAYPQVGYVGSQTETDIATFLLDGSGYTFTATGESMIGNFTLNTGAGTLTIVTKKNGVIIRTDSITTNATGISISN